MVDQLVFNYKSYHIQGDKLDTKEQACLAHCQDRYLAARVAVQEALHKRQESTSGLDY
jgi:hypothetical protein